MNRPSASLPPRRAARATRAASFALGTFGTLASLLAVTSASEAGVDGGGPAPGTVVRLAPAADAGARDAAPAPRDAGAAPGSSGPADPPPLVERDQWVFDLRYDQGDVYLVGASKIELGSPRPTPRMMGRFALELWEGEKLVERVRFDFPLLGVPEPEDAGFRGPPRLTTKLRTRTGVMFPATRRGSRLELVDRARDLRYALPWPPVAGPAPEAGVEPLRR